MYIGLLTDSKSGICCDGQWLRYGTKLPLNDPAPWIQNVTKWDWKRFMDTGVDLLITFSEKCFLDGISFRLAEGAALATATVYTDSSEPRVIGQAGDAGYAGKRSVWIPVGLPVSSCILRLEACMEEITVSDFRIWGAVFKEPQVYPMPAEQIYYNKPFLWEQQTNIVIPASPDSALSFASLCLKEILQIKHGVNVKEGNGETVDSCIFLNLDSKMQPEQYELTVNTKNVRLKAGGRKGLLYGVEALLQLSDSKKISGCHISDSPEMALRGVHLALPAREQIPFLKRMIRELLMPMRYNTLFLQITASMKFNSHPEINSAWSEAWRKSADGQSPFLHHSDMMPEYPLEQAEVADLVQYASQHGIEVIPEIQSLSHAQYITLAHPELAEIADDFYYHSCCPSNPDYYSLLFELMDEIIQVIQPRYVHMGHDEVYQIGVCPICRKSKPADLFAYHINQLYNHLHDKGIGMMIWSDMLQPASPYLTTEAIDMIPKDIVLLDFIWYFHLDKDLEDHLLANGHQVAMGNLYSSHYPRYHTRSKKKGILGGEVSTWCFNKEEILGREGKLYDFMYTANMLWSQSYCLENRASYTHMLIKLQPGIRDALRGYDVAERRYIPALPPLPKYRPNAALMEAVRYCKDPENFFRYDLSRIQLLPQGYSIDIHIKDNTDGLVFLHACALHSGLQPFQPRIQIGEYTVFFKDGSFERISIEYGKNIGLWNRPYGEPLKHPYYRHAGYIATYFCDPVSFGKTQQGEDVVFYELEWRNRKGKEIDRVHLHTIEESSSPICLAGLSAITIH